MIKNGLKHTTQSGSDIQIKHDMLPPELDFGCVALVGPTRAPDPAAAMHTRSLLDGARKFTFEPVFLLLLWFKVDG